MFLAPTHSGGTLDQSKQLTPFMTPDETMLRNFERGRARTQRPTGVRRGGRLQSDVGRVARAPGAPSRFSTTPSDVTGRDSHAARHPHPCHRD